MKLFLLVLLAAFPLLADERAEKRRLVSELLEVMDAKALLQVSFDNFVTTLATGFAESEQQPEEREEIRAFQERLFTRIDYGKYFDEVYAPVFEQRFTAEELRHLVAFFQTRHGQKLAQVLPRFGIGAEAKGVRMIHEAAETTQKELAREEMAKHPWRQTMADLRSLATAVEARATDTNEYPNVAFEELEALLAPTYIREVPKVDAWGTPFLYVADGEHYRFVSAGADRRFEWSAGRLDPKISEPTLSDDLDADIIFQDGNFIQMPRVEAEQE